jgi:hypothetical protein
MHALTWQNMLYEECLQEVIEESRNALRMPLEKGARMQWNEVQRYIV